MTPLDDSVWLVWRAGFCAERAMGFAIFNVTSRADGYLQRERLLRIDLAGLHLEIGLGRGARG